MNAARIRQGCLAGGRPQSICAKTPKRSWQRPAFGRRLGASGVHGDVKLLGGAALIRQGIGNRPTADIDASYADKAAVNAIVTERAAPTTSRPTGSTPTPSNSD